MEADGDAGPRQVGERARVAAVDARATARRRAGTGRRSPRRTQDRQPVLAEEQRLDVERRGIGKTAGTMGHLRRRRRPDGAYCPRSQRGPLHSSRGRADMLDTCLQSAMAAIMSSRGVLPPPEGDERSRRSETPDMTRRRRRVRGLRVHWGWRGSARARSAGSAPSWTRR